MLAHKGCAALNWADTPYKTGPDGAPTLLGSQARQMTKTEWFDAPLLRNRLPCYGSHKDVNGKKIINDVICPFALSKFFKQN